MISLHMQGGCLCENPPGLRLDTNNVELAALMAPRPLLMIAATGDWTDETPRLEYPAMRRIYALFGAEDHVDSIQFQAPHNYNKDSREAMYGWMARWLQQAPAGTRVAERPFTPERLSDLLVFEARSLPEGALTPEQLTTQWIAMAQRQLSETDPARMQTALLHALAEEGRHAPGGAAKSKTVVLAGADRDLETALQRGGFAVRLVQPTPYDREAASNVDHFDTYNRTEAGQRVADIVRTLDDNPGALLVAGSEFGPAALLALAVATASRAVVDIGQFDNLSDQMFVNRLYIPGLRRAGDFHTAISMSAGPVVVHNSGGQFRLDGARVLSEKLTPAGIVATLRR
jgi:hypothetical protein